MYSRLKYVYSVLSLILDLLPGNTKIMTIDIFRPTGLRFSHSWAECLRVGHKLGRQGPGTLTTFAWRSRVCMLLHRTWVVLPLLKHRWTPGHTTHSDACNDDAGHKCHEGFHPLPQKNCAVPVFSSATLLSHVSLWIRHMYRALISSPVPASIRQSCSRLGQPALPITGLTSRAFRRLLPDNILHLAVRGYLMLPNSRVIEYSNDFLFLWLLLLLETVIQYSCLNVYVAQIHIDLSSRFLEFLPESNRRPRDWHSPVL